ncbi:Eaa protein [Salmonella enterica]|nr:Eaa protein [Salmonella enterica]
MTNTKLTDRKIAVILARAEICDDSVLTDCADIVAAMRELQERRKADNQEPAGYHVIKECGRVGCSVATLEEAEKTRDFWNKKWTIRPYFYSAPPAPVVPEDVSGIIERFQYQADHLSDWHHIDEHSCKVNRRDLMTALEFMNSSRTAMLRGNHRDLSQPIGQQVAEYEKIMLQGSQPVSDRDELPVL